MTRAEPDLASLRSLPVFDEPIYLEAVRTFHALSTATYCKHAINLLNGPTLIERMEPGGSIRALANSLPIYAVSSDGLISLSLFYLVTLCEGMMMPHLQPLIALCVERGQSGPTSPKTGQHEELKQAQRNLGPAIEFLAKYGPSAFSAEAPLVLNRLAEYDAEHLSKLRNSVAHFKFRLEQVYVEAKDDPTIGSNPTLISLAGKGIESLARMLKVHNPHPGKIVSTDHSVVRYEESLKRPVTTRSKSRTYQEIRTMTTDLERLVFSLAYGFVEAGCIFQADGVIKLGLCAHCNEGHVVAPTAATTSACPACGVESTF